MSDLKKVPTPELVRELLERFAHLGASIYDECQRQFDNLDREISRFSGRDYPEEDY